MAAPTRTIRVKFDGDAKGLQAAAKRAERAVDDLRSNLERKAAGFTAAGAKMGGQIGDGMISAFNSLPAQLKLAAIVAANAIVAYMAPVIGAGISAAILLGLGGGVLAAGIIAASKDPAVAKAWSGFAERAKVVLSRFAEPFKGPMIRAADTFGAAMERISPSLTRIGQKLAPLVDKLAPALATFVERAMPGIEKAAVASAPLFETLAKHAGPLGDAVSKFFEEVAKAMPGAERFLDMLMTNLEFWIPKIGELLVWLSERFLDGLDALAWWTRKGLEYLGTFISGAAKVFGWVPELGPKLREAEKNFQQFAADVNADLDSIRNRTIRIDIETNRHGAKAFGVGGREHGGPVRAGQAYVVGEKRPELFVPDVDGVILPSVPSGTQQLGGGPGVLNLTLDLGHGIQQVVSINLRERDRGLKRRTMAGAGAR